MANEAPKIARLATDTVTTATPSMASSMAPAANLAEAGTAQIRTAMERGMEQATKAAEGSFKAAQALADFYRGNAENLAPVAQT